MEEMKYLDFMFEFLAHYYGAILLVGSFVAGILLAISADKGNIAIVKGDNNAIKQVRKKESRQAG